MATLPRSAVTLYPQFLITVDHGVDAEAMTRAEEAVGAVLRALPTPARSSPAWSTASPNRAGSRAGLMQNRCLTLVLQPSPTRRILCILHTGMTGASGEIVQYVGFATAVGREEFLERWMPFARQFSDRGARTIDLYEVFSPAPVRYISRNVWDAGTYLGTFPDGVAAGGGGGGVRVVQFGGYWMESAGGEAPDSMRIAFLPSLGEGGDPSLTSRLRCTDKVPYLRVLDLLPSQQPVLPAGSVLLTCLHVKRV